MMSAIPDIASFSAPDPASFFRAGLWLTAQDLDNVFSGSLYFLCSPLSTVKPFSSVGLGEHISVLSSWC